MYARRMEGGEREGNLFGEHIVGRGGYEDDRRGCGYERDVFGDEIRDRGYDNEAEGGGYCMKHLVGIV